MWPSQWEILVIFLVILLLFGAKRIPDMARGLGKGIREFRSAVKDVQEEVDVAGRTEGRTLAPTPAPGQVSRQRPRSAPVAAAEPQGERANDEFSG